MPIHNRILEVLRGPEDALGIEFEGRWHRMGEFANLHRQLDHIITSLGLGAHARIGLVARNRPAHVGAFASLLATQRRTVMIYASQAPEAIAADICKLAAPLVIADAEDWTEKTLYAAMMTGSAAVALTHNEGGLESHIASSRIGSDMERMSQPEIVMELLSSGTTGPPKRIPVSATTFEHSVQDSIATYASGGEGGGTCHPNVVFHPLGNIAGVTFVIPFLFRAWPFALLERFHLKEWLEVVGRHRPARASLPPTVLRLLLSENVPRDALSSFSSIGVGAAALDPELQDRFEERYGIPLLTGYGATEFCGVIANWTLDLYRQCGAQKRGSVGRARPGVTLRIVDSVTNDELPPGAVGLLEARVSRVGNDWLRTSDLASLDNEEFLYLHGRADGAINRGGFKILPAYVENILRQHEKVAEAAVVGVPDERLGEVPVAAVEPRDVSDPPTLAELDSYSRRWLLPYQVPTQFLIVSPIPRNPSMKVSVPHVRELFNRHC
jgi:long-chain acyl-CoA synthetase